MTNKPRRPWLAGLLTFLTIGLGHFYAGDAKKGLVLYFAQAVLLVILLPLFLLVPPLIVLGISLLCGFAFFLYCLLDAIKIAKDNKITYRLKKYNKWYIYLACWIVASFLIQPVIEVSIKKNIMQAYKIPSGAMVPSLLPGDHLLVDKFTYRKNKPQRGDVVIFPFPADPSKPFVKRLIGLEGDIIEVRNKQLYINNEAYAEDYIVHNERDTIPASIQPRDFFGPITIPPNSYFVMGDNRDRSFDSRFWGLVDKSTVEGKVKSIYWSWDKQNSRVRWNRIGKTIQ